MIARVLEGKALAISLWATRRQLRAASDEAHLEHQKKVDAAIDEFEHKADELYAKF